MIPRWSEVCRSIQGVWLLLFAQEDGLKLLDSSIGGFWRSFGVIVWLLPAFAINALAERTLLLEERIIAVEYFPGDLFWIGQLVALIVDWFSLPLIVAFLAKPMGFSRTYVPFIVAWNWSSLLISAPYAIIAGLYLLGLFPAGIMVLLSLSILIITLWYHFRVARIALQSSIATSIGIVALSFLLSMVIGELCGRIWLG